MVAPSWPKLEAPRVCEKAGFRDRWLIKPGHWADLVVFDQDKIAETPTYLDPYRYPVGVEHVIVNGVMLIREGAHTGALPGRPLRHHA